MSEDQQHPVGFDSRKVCSDKCDDETKPFIPQKYGGTYFRTTLSAFDCGQPFDKQQAGEFLEPLFCGEEWATKHLHCAHCGDSFCLATSRHNVEVALFAYALCAQRREALVVQEFGTAEMKHKYAAQQQQAREEEELESEN